MQNYKTIEEKAVEWNISIRHIQYLCRTGKIKNAVKRAGAWFIPANESTPSKNTKSSADFNFAGTKSKIFDTSIKLFLLKGFTNVNLKDIATAVGIRQSTIYNHFKSKHRILDTIYDFYCYHYVKERISLADIDRRVKNEDFMGIIKCIRYEFKDEYLQKMSDITKIIFQRIATDDRAKEIAKKLVVDEGLKYVKEVFDRAVESGKVAPLDTHIMAVFINSVRIYTLYNWIVDSSPENEKKFLEDEQMLYTYAVKFLTDLQSSVPQAKKES